MPELKEGARVRFRVVGAKSKPNDTKIIVTAQIVRVLAADEVDERNKTALIPRVDLAALRHPEVPGRHHAERHSRSEASLGKDSVVDNLYAQLARRFQGPVASSIAVGWTPAGVDSAAPVPANKKGKAADLDLALLDMADEYSIVFRSQAFVDKTAPARGSAADSFAGYSPAFFPVWETLKDFEKLLPPGQGNYEIGYMGQEPTAFAQAVSRHIRASGQSKRARVYAPGTADQAIDESDVDDVAVVRIGPAGSGDFVADIQQALESSQLDLIFVNTFVEYERGLAARHSVTGFDISNALLAAVALVRVGGAAVVHMAVPSTRQAARLCTVAAALFERAELVKPLTLAAYLPQCYLVLQGFLGQPPAGVLDALRSTADQGEQSMQFPVPQPVADALLEFNTQNFSNLLSRTLNAVLHVASHALDERRAQQAAALHAAAAAAWYAKYA
jgi:hypothetical protein